MNLIKLGPKKAKLLIKTKNYWCEVSPRELLMKHFLIEGKLSCMKGFGQDRLCTTIPDHQMSRIMSRRQQHQHHHHHHSCTKKDQVLLPESCAA